MPGFLPPTPPIKTTTGDTLLTVLKINKNQFITSLHPGTTWSAKQRSHWDTRLCSISIIFMSVPQKIGHPSIFVLLYLYRLIAAAGGLMFFLSHFKDFFIWSRQWYIRFHQPWARKITHNCMPHCVVWMRLDLKMKVEWEKSYSKADLSKQKWNSTLSSSQYSETVRGEKKTREKGKMEIMPPSTPNNQCSYHFCMAKKKRESKVVFLQQALGKNVSTYTILTGVVLCKLR